jgi:hypothetical protein
MSPAPALRAVSALHPHLARPPAVPLHEAVERSRRERLGDESYVQGSLALDLVPDEVLFGQQSTPASELPDPAEWAHRIGLAVAEALVGVRPPTQLVRWTTPEVYAVIQRRATVVARRALAASAQPSRSRLQASRTAGAGMAAGSPVPAARPRILVRRVHVCTPTDGVAEASVVLQDGSRVRAMALRLTGFDGRWRVEALQVA